MPRARMSDAERQAKRKARNAFTFSDRAYKHYDPRTEGYGGPDQWETIAEQLFGKVVAHGEFARYLTVLALTVMPSSLAELVTAFRAAMFKAHPDHGGTDAEARAVLEAYAVLKKKIK
jgi:hypothetical protein